MFGGCEGCPYEFECDGSYCWLYEEEEDDW